jgi:hypothetical protein
MSNKLGTNCCSTKANTSTCHLPSKLILGHGKGLQVLQNTLVSKGNLGVEIVTCFFWQHVGCQFKHCLFVGDRLTTLEESLEEKLNFATSVHN